MRGITTISYIKRYVARLPYGQMFSTREVIFCGKRSAVDKALGRLVAAGIIMRIARGIFVRANFGYRPNFSPYEVAKAKARAFGKAVAIHGMKAAERLGLIDAPTPSTNPRIHQVYTFNCSGCSSSFRYGDKIIKLKKCSERKMFGHDSKIGLVIRGLWYLGKDRCTPQDAAIAVKDFYRTDKQIIKQSLALMPAWLSDMFAA